VGVFFAAKLYRLNLLTIGDFYRQRYGKGIEVFCSGAIILSYLGWVAAQITALGLVFSVLTNGAMSETAGMVVGTPFYLAPEQARGDDVDQRIDVWAMGVLLYEMLTGTTPFRAENYNKLIVRILTTRAEPPSTRQPRLSPELEKVIMTALSHDRDDRYADAGEMLAAFQQAKRGEQPNPPLPRERATSLDVDVSVEGEDYDPTEVSDAFRR
jgi:serine/threonine protein kinase